VSLLQNRGQGTLSTTIASLNVWQRNCRVCVNSANRVWLIYWTEQ